MILDTHVHFGHNKDGTNHPVEELLAKAAAAGVDRIVQVTSASAGLDNSISFDGAARYPDRVVGVIGRLDPEGADIEERMAAYQAHPHALGVRLTTRTMGGKAALRERVYDTYFAAAQKLDLAVQIFAPFQAVELRETARRFPGLRLLVDHMAVRWEETEGADNSNMYRQWPQLIELASEPNVFIKVSYFPEASMETEKFPYPEGQRYFRELFESVGPHKLIWGSDYPPVEMVTCSYAEAVAFVRDHCTFLSASDKDAIFSQTFMTNFGPERAAR